MAIQTKPMQIWGAPKLMTGSSLAAILAIGMALFLSVAIGISLAADFYPGAAVIVGGVLAVLLLMWPGYAIVAMAGLTLAVAGSLQYFAGLGQFQWAISVLGLLLLIVALAKITFGVSSPMRQFDIDIGMIALLWWAVIAVASLGSMIPMLDWLVGVRIYLPFFGVFAYIAYCRPPERLLKGLIHFVLLIASIQWVFCLYQSTMIVPRRISGGYPGSPWDSVVGSFGGDRFGGGESGSLGVFLAIALTIAAALYKSKMLNGVVYAGITFFGLVAVGLSEAKVVVVLIPLGFLFVYRDYLLRRPVRFLMGGMLVVGSVAALLAVYNFMYWEADTRLGFGDSVIQRLSYTFDPDFRVTINNLGRIGSLHYWWKSHSLVENPLHFLLGHGFASAVSVSGIIGIGTAAKESGFLLDTTGATKLLWESGFIGLLLFQAMFVIAFVRANQLARVESIPPWHRAMLSGVQAAMVLMFLAIFYEVTTVSSPPMQFVNMLLMGYTVYWWRETGGGEC